MSCSDNIAQYVENQGVIHTFTVTQTWIDPDLGLQHHGTGSGAFHYVVNEDPGDGGPLFYLVGSAQMSLDPHSRNPLYLCLNSWGQASTYYHPYQPDELLATLDDIKCGWLLNTFTAVETVYEWSPTSGQMPAHTTVQLLAAVDLPSLATIKRIQGLLGNIPA